jgi:hypothetical protein
MKQWNNDSSIGLLILIYKHTQSIAKESIHKQNVNVTVQISNLQSN